MKHTCGIDGDPGAVTPLMGGCIVCDLEKGKSDFETWWETWFIPYFVENHAPLGIGTASSEMKIAASNAWDASRLELKKEKR